MNGEEALSSVRAQKLPRTRGLGVAGVRPRRVRSEPADPRSSAQPPTF